MTYSEALAWLYSTQHHGIKLGLENIQKLLRAIGFTGKNQRVIHVAGTNGKGSVCAMLDSICRAQGYRTGLYTSPHLVDFRERIRINGDLISEEAVAIGLTRLREIASEWEYSPTFFEVTTALALGYFQGIFSSPSDADAGCCPVEVIILETGLGGRLDATNAITPDVAVLTPIDLDHQAYLGDSLTAIAGEKAGIIKPNVPLISSTQPHEAAEVFRKVAKEKNAPIEFVEKPLEQYPIGLVGEHQSYNAALALRALQQARIEVSEDAIRAGLQNVQWPGRFQRIQRTDLNAEVILDGAHNRAASAQLLRTWKSVYGDQKATIILGILRDKDAHAICRALVPIADRFIATPVRSERSCSAQEILDAIRLVQEDIKGEGRAVPAHAAADFPSALAAAAGAPRILVTGSLFLVGEALAFFEGQQTQISSQ